MRLNEPLSRCYMMNTQVILRNFCFLLRLGETLKSSEHSYGIIRPALKKKVQNNNSKNPKETKNPNNFLAIGLKYRSQMYSYIFESS